MTGLPTLAACSALLALTTAAAPLAAVAGASPADRSASGGLPGAKVKDAAGDSDSKPFDVRWVKGSQTRTKIRLMIKVADLTAANTKAVKVDGGWQQPTGVSVLVAFDGDKDQYFGFTRSPGKSATQGAAFHHYGDGFIDCNGDAKGYGISYKADVKTDVVTIAFPRTCLQTPVGLAVSGTSYDFRGDKYRTDTVAKKAGGDKVRWSSEFTVE